MKQRIEILKQGNIISEKTGGAVLAVVDLLEEAGVLADQDKAAMFVTHLAMAIQRLEDGKVEMPFDESILAQIANHPGLSEGKRLLAGIKQLAPYPLPQAEEDFILIHLCNLLS